MRYKILNIFILFKKWLGIHLLITGRYWITNDLYILKKVLLLSVFCVNSIVIYRPIFPSFSRWTILTYFCINTDNLIQISISCSNLQMYCVNCWYQKYLRNNTHQTKWEKKCVLFDACHICSNLKRPINNCIIAMF